MRKRLTAFFFALALSVMFLPAIAAERVVRVGYIDYDAFIVPDEKGGYTGYGAEYLDMVAEYTGWRYVYQKDTWENCLEQLRAGEIDLLCTAQYTPERAMFYDYADYPLGVEYGILYVNRNNSDVYYNDYGAFDGMRVGLLKDSFQTEAFKEYARRHMFSYAPREFATDAQMTEALENGEVDAIAAGSLARKTDLKPVAKFSLNEFYFITRKGNVSLLQPLNQALEEIRMTDPYRDALLYEKYYGDSVVASKPMFTREEGEYVREHPVLRVACKADWLPYEYVDADGLCGGLSIEMLDQIAGISGLEFSYEALASDKVQSALESGSADLIASICPIEAMENVTVPYISVPMQVIGSQDSVSGEIRVLALQKGAEFMKNYLLEYWDLESVRVYDSLDSCLDAVEQGEADITVAGNYAMNKMLQEGQRKNLIVRSDQALELPLCIGLSPHLAPEARAVLNKSIALLSEADREKALRDMSFGYAVMPGFSDLWQKYRNYFVLGFVLIVAVTTGIAIFFYRRQKRRLEYSATHDTLTNCLSMEQFKKEAATLLERYGVQDYYLLKFDILHLKFINENYGTKTGDALLKLLAQRVAETLTPRELLGRVVDDNFVCLMTGDTFSRLEKMSVYGMDKIKLSLKINAPVITKCGVYKANDPDETISAMVDKASIAQKNIKQSLKVHQMVYNDTLYQKLLTESRIENEMVPALANEEFQVYFQPQINLSTMRAAAAEALIRWIRPDGSMVGPDMFIPVFERNGFVEQLDFYVLDKVCGWLRKRLDNGQETLPISVNQSRFLLFNPDYVRDVERILRRHDVPPELITLELTESMCLENSDLLVSTMARLHSLRVRISIDDFGSGYSSLNLLSEMPADELKIDRGFLGGSTGSAPKRQIITKVVELAKALCIQVVCEGVETLEQESFLKSVGCDLAQGFRYARPMPLEQLEKMFDSAWSFGEKDLEEPAIQ